jgi:hypothetical protein
VWPELVVVNAPRFDDALGLPQVGEPFEIEAVIPTMKILFLALVGFLSLAASARETEKILIRVPMVAKGKNGKIVWRSHWISRDRVVIVRPEQARIAHPRHSSDRKLPFVFEGKEYYFLLTK